MDLYYKEERILGEKDLDEINERVDNIHATNKNLLRNWYFGYPVNRQGKLSYNGTWKCWGIDGWYSTGLQLTLTLHDNYLYFEHGPTDVNQLRQELYNAHDLAGKTVTYSLLADVESGTLTCGVNWSDSGQTGASSNGTGLQVITGSYTFPSTITDSTAYIYPLIRVSSSTSTRAKLYAIKLELGPVQTLAHKENGVWVLNEIPNYAEQYMICEQYNLLNGNFIGSTQCNKNLLDNWYFQNPINRNGKTEYRGLGCTIDRYKISNNNGIVQLEDEYLHFTSNHEATYLIQPFEHKIPPGMYTMSILYRGTYGRLLFSDVTLDSISSSNDWVVRSVTFEVTDTMINHAAYVRLNGNAGAEELPYLDIKAIKLELGPVQTLAHKEGDTWVLNEVPNYAEQYAICEQYSPSTGEFIGSQHSNPNLLDNWYFVKPINQKGGTKYSGGYGIDRWSEQTSTGSVEVTDLGLKCSNTYLRQFFEDNEFFKGKTFTFSVLTADNQLLSTTGAVPSTISSGTYIIPSVSGLNLTIGVFAYPISSGILIGALIVASLTGNTLVAAKLELGPIQTLAHKEGDTWVLNDPPPKYQQELAKCQRHQFKILAKDGSYGGLIGFGYVQSTSAARITIPVPVTMRETPKLEFINGAIDGITIYVDGTIINPTNIDSVILMNNAVCIIFTGSFTSNMLYHPALCKFNKSMTTLLTANL